MIQNVGCFEWIKLFCLFLFTLSIINDIAVVIVEESTYSSVVLECHDEGMENAKISKIQVNQKRSEIY